MYQSKITVSADILNMNIPKLKKDIHSYYHYNSKSDKLIKKNCNLDIEIPSRHVIYINTDNNNYDLYNNYDEYYCFPFIKKKNEFKSSLNSFRNKGLSKWQIFKRSFKEYVD
jgi:hypothetical protein